MSRAQQLIDDTEEDDFQFRQDIRQRYRRVRMNQPRQAKAGDTVKIYSLMRNGPDIRVCCLIKDAVEVTTPRGPATEYYYHPAYNTGDYALPGEKVFPSGSGSCHWLHQPGPWGVQQVKIMAIGDTTTRF